MAIDINEEEIEKLLRPKEKRRIIKNLVVVSVAFMMQFTAYNGVANLQSSINAEKGLGTAGLAAVYAGLIFSSMFLPAVVIRLVGCKWGVSLSLLLYTPFVGVQMAPSFWSIIPAALIEGLAGGGLWCSKCTYLSALSEAFGKISNIPSEKVLVRFFGIFFMIYQLNQLWGNLISSLVLSSGDNAAAVTAVNATLIPELCGANFMPSADADKVFQEQPKQKIQLMIGIYLACMFAGSLLVAIGADSKKRYDPILSDVIKKPPGAALLAVTLRILVEPNQLLLMTINVFVGMQQAFFSADFTAAFVSCPIGTGSVGFVIMTFGVANAVGCFVTGYLSKSTGRAPLMASAAILHITLFIVMISWRPQADQEFVVYIISVMWGLCDSVWLVQVNSYYGTLFPGREEGAYANFRLWESVGFLISYVISPYLRTSTKTYVLLALMLTGMVGYFTVEIRENSRKRELDNKNSIGLNGVVNAGFKF